MEFSWVFSNVSQAGNLGFIARLMENFNQTDWRLVNCCDHLNFEAKKYSAGNEHKLQEAKLFNSLEDAVADCQIVIGTTRRRRDKLAKLTSLQNLKQSLGNDVQRVAVVFGNETSGLSNNELTLCTKLCYIPASGENSSFNISHAASIFLYELYKPAISNTKKSTPLAKSAEVLELKNKLIKYLSLIEFSKAGQMVTLNKVLSNIINRLSLNSEELNIAQSILGKTITKLSAGQDSRFHEKNTKLGIKNETKI